MNSPEIRDCIWVFLMELTGSLVYVLPIAISVLVAKTTADVIENSLKPYACAYRACCDQRPRILFNTCGELLSHWRETHESFRGTDPLEHPFMCVMDGCMRDWKNIAGIRYHIQTATNHFITDPVTSERVRNLQSEQKPIQRGPISSSRPTGLNLLPNSNLTTQPHHLPPVTTISNPIPTTTTTPTIKRKPSGKSRRSNRSDEKNAARKYLCPIEGCEKRYQQTSGLKYHLSNGPEHSAKLHRDGVSIDGLIATSTLNMLKTSDLPYLEAKSSHLHSERSSQIMDSEAMSICLEDRLKIPEIQKIEFLSSSSSAGGFPLVSQDEVGDQRILVYISCSELEHGISLISGKALKLDPSIQFQSEKEMCWTPSALDSGKKTQPSLSVQKDGIHNDLIRKETDL
ncbi:uncharacterized protein MELLADRAFT_113501 [Melampsora larici-populina 98AG31]|uniref:C2H2-type domain-containing protein n=1 Tax=Melampsora larici-populina (strain 98AG31 / pathotype 3-4-7) TaxID=747676 RepID=F4SA42_MELLP|nr:uncharacterized protein MELLADRAFT_113501 [Melampsora larici-populina 98AG31]EGF98484.1 hypothetical protein MELLADRAFT_113501 [Melampsora larici-populina 98AG31]